MHRQTIKLGSTKRLDGEAGKGDVLSGTKSKGRDKARPPVSGAVDKVGSLKVSVTNASVCFSRCAGEATYIMKRKAQIPLCRFPVTSAISPRQTRKFPVDSATSPTSP